MRLEKGLVTSRVLAGTIRHTGDDEHDLALAASLARSSKDLEEHEYAVRSVAEALEPHCTSMNVPEAPFVLLNHSCEHRGNERWNTDRRRQYQGATDRILFVRHGGGTTPPGGWRLGEFSNFGLHVQGKIAGDFSHGSGKQSESCGGCGNSFTLRMPGNAGQRQREFFGKQFSDLRAAIAERR